MGTFAEDCAQSFKFTREEQDRFAITSLERAQAANKSGWFAWETVPIAIKAGKEQKFIELDEGPFKANLDISDVLLPIAPFTETSCSFVNAEGRLQSFHAVVKPLGETRPAWKVIRVLGNLMGLPGFDAESSQAVLAAVLPGASAGEMVAASRLSNADAGLGPAAADQSPSKVQPCVASIYQLDSLVRRASSLQLTADARAAEGAHA